jgi:tRNA dimethylallyltransferase
LIDIIDPSETFSVSRYRDMALTRIADIRSRGKEVLFVGGSALYLKTLLRGLFDGPPADWAFREQIEQEVREVGEQALHSRLQMFDPVSAHKLHVNDRRRIIRALEVLHLTGKPISHWQMEFDHALAWEDCRVFTLRHPRERLHERIAQRVTRMFEQGFVEEVQYLAANFPNLSHTARQAVGYCEVLEYLAGQRTLADAQEQTLIRTRRFARHQETWFRGLSECQLWDLPLDFEPSQVAADILASGRARRGFAQPATS